MKVLLPPIWYPRFSTIRILRASYKKFIFNDLIHYTNIFLKNPTRNFSDASFNFYWVSNCCILGFFSYCFGLAFWSYADNSYNMFLNLSSEQHVSFSQVILEVTSSSSERTRICIIVFGTKNWELCFLMKVCVCRTVLKERFCPYQWFENALWALLLGRK